MRKRSLTIALLLTAVLAVTSTACGGDDDGGGGGGGNAAVNDENRPYVDALKDAMRESNEEDGDVVMTDAQIDCMAPRWINTIGVDTLQEHDVAPEDLAGNTDLEFTELGLGEEEGGALYDAFGQCDMDLREMIIGGMAEDEEMSDAAKACMEGVFTDENLRKFMVASLVSGDEGMEDDPEIAPIVGQMMGCAFMGMGDGAEEEFEDIGSSINAD